MEERRKHQRRKTFKGASISRDRGTRLACIVRNLSEGGACLEVDRPNELPENFTLTIRPECVRHSCHIAWRTATHAGVQLLLGREGRFFFVLKKATEATRDEEGEALPNDAANPYGRGSRPPRTYFTMPNSPAKVRQQLSRDISHGG
jgi:hypothetical protein